ncbi:MAG: MFS transporter [Dehalococcoidia bacterium]|nr:MFS transporter [Dehalococcoidia bacterium]
MTTTEERTRESTTTHRPSPFRALYNPQYRLLWFASFLSISMSMMQWVARGWLVLEMTNSPFYVGLTAAANSLPMLIFSMFGGVLADRYDRRKILIANEVVGALCYSSLAFLVLFEVVQVWHILAISVVSGLSFALSMPSRQAIIPNLVKREDLGNAIALSTVMFSGSQTIGPALAGVLLATIGVSWVLLLAAAVLVVPMALLSMLKPQVAAQHRGDESIIANLAGGFRYIKQNTLIPSLIFMGAVSTIFVMPYQALMPVFARDVLHAGSEGLGILLGAAGVGALVGSLILASIDVAKHLGKLLLTAAVIGGIALVPFAMSSTFALSVVLVLFVGLMMQLQTTSNFTAVQLTVPDEFRGRVLSIRMVIFGMMPLGQLAGGWASEVVGAPAAIAATGIIASVLMAAIIVASKDIRGLWGGLVIK